MEVWLLVIFSVSLSALLKASFDFFFPTEKPTHSVPPAPFSFPIIGNILWLRKASSEFEHLIRSLHAKLGPIITLHIGSSRPAIFVADRSLAHQALIKNGAVFANRPPPSATSRINSCNQHNISSAFYGPTWRLLRRNLTSEILHPSRLKSYANARDWVLQVLKARFELLSKSEDPVLVADHFQYGMFCLLAFMCFGGKFDQRKIEEIHEVERCILSNSRKFNILNFCPRLTKIFLRKKWAQFLQLRKDRARVLLPLIRARKRMNEERLNRGKEDSKSVDVVSYVDTLLELQLPDEKRKLNEEEMVTLCSEFLNAGTDTTSTALQWLMANLVKYPKIQEKLFMEIKGVVGHGEEVVKEEDLQKMPYLKAIILEGLRRHPPARFLLPHAVTEDVVLDKYLVPKKGTINFMVAEMGLDPKVWEDPLAFKPERFLNNGGETFDITGSREIKMMPFGAGRRICPATGFAMFHLEYFVANLVWSFEWKAVDGDDVDLSAEQVATSTMKNPLQSRISPRFENKVYVV